MSADQVIGEVRAPAAVPLGSPSVLRVDAATDSLAVAVNGSLPAAADVTASGVLTNAADVVQIATAGRGQVAITFKGSAGAPDQLIAVEGRVFGSAIFTPVMMFDPALVQAGSTQYQSSVNANATRIVPCAGYDLLQVRCVSATANTTSVFMEGSAASPNPAACQIDAFSPTVLKQDFSVVTAQVSTQPAVLVTFALTNRNGATRNFQIFNQAAALVGGEVPFMNFPVGPQQALYVGKEILALLKMTVAMVYGWSTTPATYTAATPADHDTVILGKKVAA